LKDVVRIRLNAGLTVQNTATIIINIQSCGRSVVKEFTGRNAYRRERRYAVVSGRERVSHFFVLVDHRHGSSPGNHYRKETDSSSDTGGGDALLTMTA